MRITASACAERLRGRSSVEPGSAGRLCLGSSAIGPIPSLPDARRHRVGRSGSGVRPNPDRSKTAAAPARRMCECCRGHGARTDVANTGFSWLRLRWTNRGGPASFRSAPLGPRHCREIGNARNHFVRRDLALESPGWIAAMAWCEGGAKGLVRARLHFRHLFAVNAMP